ncbi:MAG TPA: hypothetical protein PL143_20330 [Rhodocyclaceae bacterium]|nr:hypothetical protein [Rhodocyclaceae bacterium]
MVVLINGVDGAGKGETVNLLDAWMDPRHIESWAFDAPTSEEVERPHMWRFWRALPPKGRIGVLFGNWYSQPIHARVARESSKAELDQRLDQINRFEAMVQVARSGEGPREQLARFREDWRNRDKWDDYARAVCDMIDRTSTEAAPWTLVEAENKYFARIKVLRTICERLEAVLGRG